MIEEPFRTPSSPSFRSRRPSRPGSAGAPSRGHALSRHDTAVALANALRYVPGRAPRGGRPGVPRRASHHRQDLRYRYRPAGRIFGRPIDDYAGRINRRPRRCRSMIDNNLDFEVALLPVRAGHLTARSGPGLPELDAVPPDQEVPVRGHGGDTRPSSSARATRSASSRHARKRRGRSSPNGLMIGMFDTPEHFHRLAALGLRQLRARMTAGGWMYIGSAGHRPRHPTSRLLNAGRLYLGHPRQRGLRGTASCRLRGSAACPVAQGKALRDRGRRRHHRRGRPARACETRSPRVGCRR